LFASVGVAELLVEVLVLVDETEALELELAVGGAEAQTVPRFAGSLKVSLNKPLETPYLVPVTEAIDMLPL
jgi:hypothetical protein